jgi:dynein light intermediate chain 1
MLEQTQDYKDEQFDFIQQTLRCICMKCKYHYSFIIIIFTAQVTRPSLLFFFFINQVGASLFYTSTLQPFTFHNLRQYILHRLLSTPTKSYPFNMKAQVVERDTVLVPSGWDSFGKLRVLREGFDCEAVHQGWESDIDALTDRQQPGSYGARGVYEEVIADPALEEQPLSNAPPPVTCEDEQAFFERHFETLQRATELPNSRQGTGANAKPSVVGPLGFTTNAIDLVRTGEDRLSDAVKVRERENNGTSK